MMVSVTSIVTGEPGDENRIHINWHDENRILHHNILTVNVEPFDQPRTLTIALDGKVLANLSQAVLV